MESRGAEFSASLLGEEHFRLFFLCAVGAILSHLDATVGSREAVERQFPFLCGYRTELSQCGIAAWEDWHSAVADWEARAPGPLPIAKLRRAAGLEIDDIVLLAMIGLAEEDPRFGFVFEALHGIAGQQRLTAGLVHDWANRSGTPGVRKVLRHLGELGLVTSSNQDAARAQWGLQVAAPCWDAMRGEASETPLPWARHRTAESLAPLDALVLAPAARSQIERLPELLAAGEVTGVIIRGPRHNGRRAVAGALARALGSGVLEIDSLGKPEEQRLRTAGSLCTLLGAVPLVVMNLIAGESVELPRPAAYDGPLLIVMGRQGGVTGAAVERAITISLDLPTPAERREHWRVALPAQTELLDELATSFRMASGNLRSAARIARSYAVLAHGSTAAPIVTVADVRNAARSLHRPALETVATRIEGEGDWSHLSVSPETRRELDQLTVRCRAREAIGQNLGIAFGAKVGGGLRVLFQGPSGTGKTFAALLLASTLGKDLYRLEVSSVVNKYIGETEKNLGRAFELAEELDVVLLLDEGDALLARRTGVQSSTDRYANLETNFLLQRLETFEGIVVITTNASEHIDRAFQRRMDVVIDFRPPDISERLQLWQLHLPTSHAASSTLLRELASRCHMTGGQVRNAVLHAQVLALGERSPLTDEHLVAAVQREYRKAGAVCPLRNKGE